MKLKIVKNRKIFLAFSVVLISVAVYALTAWGLNFGIDFTGGNLLEVKFDNYQPSVMEIQDSLADINLPSLTIQPTENSVILRFKSEAEDTRALVMGALEGLAGEQEGAQVTQLQFDSVGASIGQELKSKSFNAALIVFIMIILYISWTFRSVSKPVSSWKYGVTAILALVHDVIMMLGVFAFLGHFTGSEVNTPFIAAILTVLGYSVTDTIVVFDRVRENLPKSNDNFADTVNRSINQTISRSLATSFTSVLTLLAILFFGGSTIKDFALALAIGITVGTYSSLFVASPILVVWNNLSQRRK